MLKAIAHLSICLNNVKGSHYIYIFIYTGITEVNLSAFVYRLFHEDFSSLVGTSIEHSTTCDSRTNLNYIMRLLYY